MRPCAPSISRSRRRRAARPRRLRVERRLGLVVLERGRERPRLERPPRRTSARRTSSRPRRPGTLTVATDKPAYPPYFEDDDPTNGKGFESAVAYAIADKLGFAKTEVKWTIEPFNSSYAPGPKKFDFDVNQISITPARAEARRLLVAVLRGAAGRRRAARARTPPARRRSPTSRTPRSACRSGRRASTRSTASIEPTSQPQVFDDSNDVVTALKQKQVDAVVVDLPTAFYLTAAQVADAKIVGQFAAPGGDTWGALLAKGSPLTACVDQAVDELKASGELRQIEQRWLGDAAGAPALK